MKRKITFLALAGNGEAFGAWGSMIVEAEALPFPSIEVRATEPRLSPQSFINQRRENERCKSVRVECGNIRAGFSFW
jgi:hypothetical protein